MTPSAAPIRHTVVFRLSHQPGSAEEAEFLAAAERQLTSIDGVTDFTISRQVSAKSDLQWQFSMVFAEQSSYDAYNIHPAHKDFVESRWKHEVLIFQEYDFTAP